MVLSTFKLKLAVDMFSHESAINEFIGNRRRSLPYSSVLPPEYNNILITLSLGVGSYDSGINNLGTSRSYSISSVIGRGLENLDYSHVDLNSINTSITRNLHFHQSSLELARALKCAKQDR